jgi:hypothetical protein
MQAKQFGFVIQERNKFCILLRPSCEVGAEIRKWVVVNAGRDIAATVLKVG